MIDKGAINLVTVIIPWGSQACPYRRVLIGHRLAPSIPARAVKGKALAVLPPIALVGAYATKILRAAPNGAGVIATCATDRRDIVGYGDCCYFLSQTSRSPRGVARICYQDNMGTLPGLAVRSILIDYTRL